MKEKINNSQKKNIVFLIIFAFLIRIVFILIASEDIKRFFYPDSYSYLNLANSISYYLSFSNINGPEIFRAPGYPFFISIFTFLFNKPVLPVIISQAVIDTGTCYLTYLLFFRLCSNNSFLANWAFLLQAISIVSIVQSASILSETVFTFLFILMLLILEIILKQKSIKKIYSIGIIMGIMSLVRPVALPLILLFIIYIWYRTREKILVIKYIIPIIIILGCWIGRNYYEADYIGISTVGSINMYRDYACSLKAKQKGISYAEQQLEFDNKLKKIDSETERSSYAQKEAIKIIKTAPLYYLAIHLKNDLKVLLPDTGGLFKLLGFELGSKGTLGVINTHGIIYGVKYYFKDNWKLFFISVPFILLLLFKYFGFLYFVISVFFLKLNLKYLFYIIIVAYFILIPGAGGTPRFRSPIEPLLAIFGVYGIWLLFCTIKKARNVEINISSN